MNDFNEQLETSYRYRDEDIRIIGEFFPLHTSIIVATVAMDKAGADYIVTMKGGKELNVDVKRRIGEDCKKYARHGEMELALETYSIVEDETHQKKYGWTVDPAKVTDYILYAFDRNVCDVCYIFPYQSLKQAFIRYFKEWKSTGYSIKQQDNGGYKSEAMFVPVSVLRNAIHSMETIRC